MTHIIGIGLIIGGALVGALVLLGLLEKWRIRREEDRQRDAFLPDTQLMSASPWDGATYAYPGSWEWPEDQSVTQFLDAAPEIATPVMGIRTEVFPEHPSGPFRARETGSFSAVTAEDTDAWIMKMYADTDAVIARLCTPLTETAWR